jgi:hypothetical protein
MALNCNYIDIDGMLVEIKKENEVKNEDKMEKSNLRRTTNIV